LGRHEVERFYLVEESAKFLLSFLALYGHYLSIARVAGKQSAGHSDFEEEGEYNVQSIRRYKRYMEVKRGKRVLPWTGSLLYQLYTHKCIVQWLEHPIIKSELKILCLDSFPLQSNKHLDMQDACC
jgi:hypothetical protein